MTHELPRDVLELSMNGRATDAQFAQNPLPLLTAMGYGLAALHASSIDGLVARTAGEVSVAIEQLTTGAPAPAPYERSTGGTLISILENQPSTGPVVRCHGAPVVGSVLLVNSVATFEGDSAMGADPAERDLAIALRSIAEAFSAEATRTFLEGYEAAGGVLPSGPALDWYALVAAFR